jgi:DNA replication protein DnaC
MAENKEAIDEAELRRLEGDARERMGLPRDRPVESFSASTRVSGGLKLPTRLEAVQAPEPVSEEERTRRQREKRLARVDRVVPERYAGLTLDSPNLAKRVVAKTAIEAARRLLDSPGLVFVGGSGTGKTTLACAGMADWIVAKGGTPYFVACRALAAARAAHSLGEGEADIVERALAADLLILDDLGVGDDAHRSAVGDVIDERYDRMRVTWVTTGFDSSNITQKYGVGRSRRVFAKPNEMIACGLGK